MRYSNIKLPAVGIQRPWTRSSTSATRSYIGGWGGSVSCVVLVLFLFSCSSVRTVRQGNPVEEMGTVPPRYSIVCIIHGDGDYLYHDPRGNALRADDEALGRVAAVAVNNPQAEVFVFHEKQRRRALLFFPLRDGKFYYYRNGRLIAEEKPTGVIKDNSVLLLKWSFITDSARGRAIEIGEIFPLLRSRNPRIRRRGLRRILQETDIYYR